VSASAETSSTVELGQRIRTVRRRRHVTMRELAARAGLSVSLISQVERGRTNPSISTLRRLAEGLNESVAVFFEGEESAGTLVRANNRRRMVHPSGVLEDYLLTPAAAKTMQIHYSVIGPRQGSGEPYTHTADEECVIVIDGSLEVTVDGEALVLDAGDALMLDPRLPHSYHNPGDTPTTSIWVMSPPGY
jgi:transcriptional regulator with XRE-family HTH domain